MLVHTIVTEQSAAAREGLLEARARHEVALDRGVDGLRVAMVETLMWLQTLADLDWPPDSESEMFVALKWARDGAVHAAVALHQRADGASWPLQWPIRCMSTSGCHSKRSHLHLAGSAREGATSRAPRPSSRSQANRSIAQSTLQFVR